MGLLNSLFGSGNEKMATMLTQGAVIIDVRTAAEFSSGHVAGSKIIPLQEIGDRVGEIKKMNKPVILCCASGMRSGQASRFLGSKGIDCINGGGWSAGRTGVVNS